MLRIFVNKADIVQIFGRIQTIVDKKTTMTILNNAFLYTDENHLFIEATDLEIGYKGKIDCLVVEQGAITVIARKFYEIVKEFPSREIQIEEDGNLWLTIGGGGKAEYKIGGLSPDDFPRFRQLQSEKSVTIDSQILREMIEKTIFSVSLDESKYSLAGIFLEEESIEGDKSVIRMVSSDGHRLTVIEKSLPKEPLNLEAGVIIPRKGAQEIRKLIEGHRQVTFGFGENFCFVNAGDDNLVVRLIDAKFPDYRSIIPATKERFLNFDRIAVFDALKRISILFVDTSFRGVKASITPGVMEIASLADLGEARETVEVNYEGEPFEVAFNAKYIIDALGVMRSTEVEMTSNNEVSPCLLKGPMDPGFSALVMPISIKEEEATE